MPERILYPALRPGQIFVRLQAPFLVGLTTISGATLMSVPELAASRELWVGLMIVAIASGLFALPRRGWMMTGWVLVIPVLDLVSIAAVRTAMISYVPTIGMLCLIPFAWIAYRFRWPALFLILALGVFIAALPFALGARPVTGLLAVVNVLALPFIATSLSLAIHVGCRSFDKRRKAIIQATCDLHGALRQSHETQLLLRSVFDTVNGAVAYYNSDEELVLANRAAEEMVEIVGFRLDVPPYAGPDVLAADRKTAIPFDQQLIPRALRGEVIANHIEWLGRPGRQMAIMASSRQVHREDGTLLGTVVAAYDVTELADAIEVREEFLTTVSHELRTPLTSIIGYTEEIADVLGDRARELGIDAWLATILRNADTLLTRVSDLLNVSDKEMQVDLRRTDVSDVVHRTVESFAVSAGRAGIDLVADAPQGLVAHVDASRLTQAVENLIGNAVKFTARGGRVAVNARRDDEEIVISVSDTGIGMTPDEQRRVFDRFYRAQAVRENAIQGIGIGLSLVKTIVDAHGGEVTIDSAPGQGSTVGLRLPLRLASDAEDPLAVEPTRA